MAADITSLLAQWSEGKREAMDQLMPLVYEQLHALARRLVPSEIPASSRAHFFALCARLMRRILIDHARASVRHKRGGGAPIVALDGIDVASPGAPEQVMAIHEALEKLAELDARKAQAVELVVFGGLEQEIAAEALNISPATLRRDLKIAKAWLYQSMRHASRERGRR
jgi:RNA polymerase sigma-70 factor, ECF subfamily